MFPLHDENRPSRKPLVNYMLLAANIIVFFYFYLQGPYAFEEAIKRLGFYPIDFLRLRRLHTLLTSMFMHGDLMHLAGNMLYLYIFGDNVEDAFGHGKYLPFYLACGLGAAIVHTFSILLMPSDLMYMALRVPAVGASGAISGILGAYVVLYPLARIRTLVVYWTVTVVSIPAYYFIGFWFLYQLMMGVMALRLPLGVAFWAHIGGFATGVLLVKLLRVRPRKRRRVVVVKFKPVTKYDYYYY